MGLLDDAIREHLDLKRRRGADPTEIERAEREALGPVRRGPEFTGEDAPQPETAVEPEAGTAPAPGEEWVPVEDEAEGYEPEQPLEDHEPLAYEPDDQVSGGAPPVTPAPFDLEADLEPPGHPEEVAPAPEPEPDFPRPHPADPPPAAGRSHIEQETEEYELESEEQQEGDDDMLESTPEFLQDTPDHDRLWFEQRPPKDFDFDG